MDTYDKLYLIWCICFAVFWVLLWYALDSIIVQTFSEAKP